MIVKVACSIFSPRDAFDLFNVVDLKTGVCTVVPLHQERHKDRPLAVGMNTTAGPLVKGREKQGRTRRGLQFFRPPKIGT